MDYYIKDESGELYIYFDTTQKCIDFIGYINDLNRNIKVKRNLSENKSCCLKGIYMDNVQILITEFKMTIPILNSCCDICYEIKNLYPRCHTCMHPLCLDCFERITDERCPYCRSL